MFKRIVDVYHDEKLVSSKRMWVVDADEYADSLERDGFVYGYTQDEVDEAKRIYEEKLANLIGGNK